jgi:hypothetical protein
LNIKGGPRWARHLLGPRKATLGYFVLGVAVVGGFVSFTPVLSSVFFPSGVVPGLAGVTDGDATGDASGDAVATGDGVVTTFGFVTLALLAPPEHAPRTKVEAAKIDVNINDLLTVITS